MAAAREQIQRAPDRAEESFQANITATLVVHVRMYALGFRGLGMYIVYIYMYVYMYVYMYIRIYT